MFESMNIYFPKNGKNLLAVEETRLQENGSWSTTHIVKVRGTIVVYKPEGGVKYGKTA